MKILDYEKYIKAGVYWAPYDKDLLSPLVPYPHETIKYLGTPLGYYDIKTMRRQVYQDKTIFPMDYHYASNYIPYLIDSENLIYTYNTEYNGVRNKSFYDMQNFKNVMKTFREHQALVITLNGFDYSNHTTLKPITLDFEYYSISLSDDDIPITITDKNSENSITLKKGRLVDIDASSDEVNVIYVDTGASGHFDIKVSNLTANTSVDIDSSQFDEDDNSGFGIKIYDIDYANKTIKAVGISSTSKRMYLVTVTNYNDPDTVSYTVDKYDINNFNINVNTNCYIDTACMIINNLENEIFLTVVNGDYLLLFKFDKINNIAEFISATKLFIQTSVPYGYPVLGYETKLFLAGINNKFKLYRFTESGWIPVPGFNISTYVMYQFNNLLYYSTDTGLHVKDLEALDSFGISFKETNDIYYDGNDIENSVIISKVTRTDMNYRIKLIIDSFNAKFKANNENVYHIELTKNMNTVEVPIIITGPGNVDVKLIVEEEFTDSSDRTAILNSSIELNSSTEVTITTDDEE